MAKGEKNSTWISIQCTEDEKATLDEAVKASGLTRNRFLRNFIAPLRGPSK